MTTSFAFTAIDPVTSRLVITLPGRATVMPADGVSRVPGGTPVVVGSGYPHTFGDSTHRRRGGGGEPAGAVDPQPDRSPASDAVTAHVPAMKRKPVRTLAEA